MMEESPIVREVRERAMQIEARFGHDLHKYCEYLREQERNTPTASWTRLPSCDRNRCAIRRSRSNGGRAH